MPVSHPLKKILYVITDLEVGGVPLHLQRLAVAMKKRGFAPSVVSLVSDGRVGRALREDGIEVRSCDGRHGWDFRVIRRLTQIIEEERPDIIHALLFHANVAARLAAHQAGFSREQLLCEIQTVEVERRWHLVVDRFTHSLCRFTIVNSPSVIEHLHRHAGIPTDRLRLVRGGIDPKPFQGAEPIDRSALGLPVSAPMVLWIGRLDPVKGLDTLIPAFGSVVSDCGAHLLVTGRGPFQKALVQIIDRHGLASHVHLLGVRSDVPALLRTADVFAFPSRTEGLPNALLEAMAAGCPIVTTDVSGCRDLIEHERTGLIVPYGDTKALAGAITRLLRDSELSSRLGQNASVEVAEEWHFRQTLDAYAAVYATLDTDLRR